MSRRSHKAREKPAFKLEQLSVRQRQNPYAPIQVLSAESIELIHDGSMKILDWTNEFGLNWQRPLYQLALISIFAYFLLLCSINGGYNPEYWKHFFVFLNPIHKTQFIADGYWNGWTNAIDFVFRIIEGLLIYQTIQAFRKYSRKL